MSAKVFDRAEVRERLLDVFRDHAPDGAEITAKTTILGDLGLDSLGVMEVVVDVETVFAVSMPEDGLVGLETVGDVEGALLAFLQERGRLR